jgi:hypothetical protein
MRRGFFLRDLGGERNTLCSLTVAKMEGGELAAMGQLGRSSTMVGATFSGALAPGTAPAAALMAGTPPPSNNLTREGLTRWGDGTSSGGYGG